MNKTVLIVVILAIGAGLFAFAYQLTAPSPQATSPIPPLPVTNNPTSNTGGTTSTPHPSTPDVNSDTPATVASPASTIAIPAINGGTLEAKDFMKNPTTAEDPVNKGYFYLGYHVNEGVADSSATDDPPYVITYIASTKYFNIALLHEPIGAVRGDMEQYLTAQLGLSQDHMCRLNYMVSVPVRVNDQYAGGNLGFSFCPGATVLPN